MSTTIITNQTAIKFPVKAIIDGLEHDANRDTILPILETVYAGTHLFNTWQDEYCFLVEEYIESNVFPQTPKWNAFLPVMPTSDIVCGYIDKALTSFEGGMVRFKGAGHTKPEAALRKLRATLDDAPSFEDYLRFNPVGLHFSFDMQEDFDGAGIIKALGFDVTQPTFNRKTSKHAIEFIRFDFHVKKMSDILKVIMVKALEMQSNNISLPRFKGTIHNKITNAWLKKVNVA
jgi:hypothetical protein